MSTSSQPPRRFKPEPLETTTKTSSRRFAPEPVETSTKSSKHRHPTEDNAENASKKTPRKFAVEPVETSHTSSKDGIDSVNEKKPRKFAVEPVETSHVGSKHKANNGKEAKPRRFAPQPVETSHVSSKDKASPHTEGKPRAHFAPQLLETSEKAHRRKSANDANSDAAEKPTRKFAPQLIETAQRSRKAGDVGPAVLHSDRTEATPEEHSMRKHYNRRSDEDDVDPLDNTPYRSRISEDTAEARRLGKPLPKRQTSRDSNRSHSFYVPELAPIESSQSERSDDDESNIPSLSTSPSIGSDMSSSHMHATRVRESVDDRFSGYFLELAARAAERQMRDQALAAFPNDDRHDPIDHYINKEDDDSYMSDTWSVAEGDSSGAGKFMKINWELRELQKHAEGKAAAKEAERKRKEAWRDFQKKTSANGPWGDAAAKLYQSAAALEGKNMIGEQQERDGLKQMQNGARPPMLGSDITFPRCPSPEPARFDVTQGSEKLREDMCYLTEQSNAASQAENKDCHLWNKPKNGDRPSLWSRDEETPEPEKGLWAGCCVGTGLTPPRGPTGLMTPYVNFDDPHDVALHTRGPHQLPPSPPPSNSGVSGSLEEKLEFEQAIDAEFSDAFVTQVYNYLSLGYPSMARKYDLELSKISRISVQELRADDAIVGAGARGYIRLGEASGPGCEDEHGDPVFREEHCARWRALRLYVREWARQQPSWHGQNGGGWGTVVRRGSWAW
ncbi:hypothetical protein NA57DRAFT_74826 [Rhizodiscina lignyota]|uniref:Uncharacterized protein n=1 Tax=Rhizodiscina lignyota TaxID=1504668 RepID=A0A9P4M6W0_9PEZI|nr:hypothetical protein NA57DRAFT_74826 [Rhizodiscina lignyota]